MSKRPTFELKRLRSALAIFVLLSAGSGYFCYESYNYLQEKVGEENLVMQQIREIQQREQQDIERRRVHKEYSRVFSRLDKEGLFSESKKLDWVEKIEMAARQLRIPKTDYVLNSSEKIPLPDLIQAQELGLYKTDIQLNMTMLHEGDLLAFENYLRNQKLGLFSFESCEIQRTRDNPSFSTLEPMMSAECVVNVYNFKFDDNSINDMSIDMGMPAPQV